MRGLQWLISTKRCIFALHYYKNWHDYHNPLRRSYSRLVCQGDRDLDSRESWTRGEELSNQWFHILLTSTCKAQPWASKTKNETDVAAASPHVHACTKQPKFYRRPCESLIRTFSGKNRTFCHGSIGSSLAFEVNPIGPVTISLKNRTFCDGAIGFPSRLGWILLGQ